VLDFRRVKRVLLHASVCAFVGIHTCEAASVNFLCFRVYGARMEHFLAS
jgi:hypothetical protein